MQTKKLFNLLFRRKIFRHPASFTDPRNIKAFFQGHMREIEESFSFLPLHIKEQAAWRLTKAKPECILADQCMSCGCSPMKSKVMEDRGCSEGCYPPMMKEEEWENFKKTVL